MPHKFHFYLTVNIIETIYTFFVDDEDYEPPAPGAPAVVPKDKWEGEDSDDDNIKASWDQVSLKLNDLIEPGPASSDGERLLLKIGFNRPAFDTAVLQEFFAPVSIQMCNFDSLKKCPLLQHAI